METETIVIVLICSNLLFLALGFWMGRLSSNQAIPKIVTGPEKPFHEDDPYDKAMQEPEEERKETT